MKRAPSTCIAWDGFCRTKGSRPDQQRSVAPPEIRILVTYQMRVHPPIVCVFFVINDALQKYLNKMLLAEEKRW